MTQVIAMNKRTMAALLIVCLVAASGTTAAIFLESWRLAAIGGVLLAALVIILIAGAVQRIGRIERITVRQSERELQNLEQLRERLRGLDISGEVDQAMFRHMSVFKSQMLGRQDVLDGRIRQLSTCIARDGSALAEGAGLTTSLEEIRSSMHRLQAQSAEHELQMAERLRYLEQAILAEADALGQIVRRFPSLSLIPPLSGWALSPRGMLQVLMACESLANSESQVIVLECGSGASTLYLGALADEVGNMRVISLEHSEEYLARIRSNLEDGNIGSFVDLRYAPLERLDLDGEQYTWYRSKAFEDVTDVSVILVDGPPGTVGPLARYPALPCLSEKLSAGSMVILDDIQRDDEKSILKRWLAGFPVERRMSITRDQGVLRWLGDSQVASVSHEE